MSNQLDKFKIALKNAMLENFKQDGYLAPMLFFNQDDQPIMEVIPKEFLINVEGKKKLAEFIKGKCCEPNVLAAGMIIEAHGAVLEDDTDETNLVL